MISFVVLKNVLRVSCLAGHNLWKEKNKPNEIERKMILKKVEVEKFIYCKPISNLL